MEQIHSYQDAFNELLAIVTDIETGEVTIDELAQKIKRASQLLEVCKTKLTASQEEVDRLLEQLAVAKEREETSEEE